MNLEFTMHDGTKCKEAYSVLTSETKNLKGAKIRSFIH